MSEAATSTMVVDTRTGPSFLIRALWFVLVGWWLSFLFITLIALVNLTIIGIPLGLWLANRIPQVVTLKFDRARHTTSIGADGQTTTTIADIPQRPFWQRALWYVFIGSWLTIFALYFAWLLSITIIGLPLAFAIFSSVGKLLTLKRG